MIILQVEWGFKGVEQLLNIHPLFVHFPIALILSAVLFYCIGVVFGYEPILTAGKWALFLGTLSAAATVWTGLVAERTVPHSKSIDALMTTHEYFGIAVLIISALLSLWVLISKRNIPEKGGMLFLTCLIFLAVILAQGADFGARMVYQHGIGMGRKSMMQHEEKAGYIVDTAGREHEVKVP